MWRALAQRRMSVGECRPQTWCMPWRCPGQIPCFIERARCPVTYASDDNILDHAEAGLWDVAYCSHLQRPLACNHLPHTTKDQHIEVLLVIICL